MIEPVASAATSAAVKVVTEGIIGYVKRLRLPQVAEKFNIVAHMREIEAWSDRVQIFRMPTSMSTSQQTVALGISQSPRRFARSFSQTEILTEEELIYPGRHLVILGDPGSGKTTTIKRLIRVFFEERERDIILKFPLRIILRSLESDGNIWAYIAKCIGLIVTYVDYKNEDGTTSIRMVIGDRAIDDVIVEVLNDNGALLLVDGLDEVNIGNRDSTCKILEILASRLYSSQIIVTCRSGDYNNSIDGFDVVELMPLSNNQIEKICEGTLQDPGAFILALNEFPYRDLANRPLFLIFLLMIFHHRGRLPDRPVDIYRKVSVLALEEWDRERSVARRSKYGNFDAEAKLDFLSLLAYQMTFVTKNRSFSKSSFEKFYGDNASRFSLPRNEAESVASEIESHTGLIVDASWQNYEFCHLSIQEYLAARYIVAEPYSKRIRELLRVDPASIAVAIALSSDPNAWLLNLILNPRNRLEDDFGPMMTMLERVALEKPNFYDSVDLGYALLYLIDKLVRIGIGDAALKKKCDHWISMLMFMMPWQESLVRSIKAYSFDVESLRGSEFFMKFSHGSRTPLSGKEFVLLRETEQYRGHYEIRRPTEVLLPRPLVRDLVRNYMRSATGFDETGFYKKNIELSEFFRHDID